MCVHRDAVSIGKEARPIRQRLEAVMVADQWPFAFANTARLPYDIVRLEVAIDKSEQPIGTHDKGTNYAWRTSMPTTEAWGSLVMPNN